MGYSLDNQINDSTQFKAPDPLFIATVQALSQGFPWERFERFFDSRPLINASAVDQVFLMRVLALQEMLCLNDADVLKWVKNQLYLFAFVSPHYKPRLPNETVLENFRQRLDELKMLQPFRLRCQQLILKYGEMPDSLESPAVPGQSGEFDAYLYSDSKLESSAEESIDFPEIEERWVTCPLCDSSELGAYAPASLDIPNADPWADCQQCGHKFKVG